MKFIIEDTDRVFENVDGFRDNTKCVVIDRDNNSFVVTTDGVTKPTYERYNLSEVLEWCEKRLLG